MPTLKNPRFLSINIFVYPNANNGSATQVRNEWMRGFQIGFTNSGSKAQKIKMDKADNFKIGNANYFELPSSNTKKSLVVAISTIVCLISIPVKHGNAYSIWEVADFRPDDARYDKKSFLREILTNMEVAGDNTQMPEVQKSP